VKNALRPRVPETDHAVTIGRDDRIARGGENGLRESLGNVHTSITRERVGGLTIGRLQARFYRPPARRSVQGTARGALRQ